MEMYDISSDTMKKIFKVADDIATYSYEISIQNDKGEKKYTR